jgi:hypothetical protein
MEIYKKLGRIQEAIKGLSKDKKSHNYDYVTGNKLLSFLKPLMDKEGLLLKQEITDIQNVRQDYKTKYGDKSEILTTIKMLFTWVDIETGEKDENRFAANGQNDWEKGLGSALTYGERYFLLKYFHIQTDKDDIDNPNRKPVTRIEKKEVTLSITDAIKTCHTEKSLMALYRENQKEVTANVELLSAFGAQKKLLGL